ncbi:MAG: methyl-accepting chemotaxis protein [Oscillospiraceae bacterium]|nr:methyl-accepting chemotaxis protein [Oscillospiraceae bacterium]
MKFKKLSWKLTVIVVATVIGVAGTVTSIFQVRMSARLDQWAQEQLRVELATKIAHYDRPFTESSFIALSLRNFAEANFEPAAFRARGETYFEEEFRPLMEQFVINSVVRSDYIDGAYFSVHYQMSGTEFIGEVFVVSDGYGGYEIAEPYEFADYDPNSGVCMEWFLGAYNSRESYWSVPYVSDESGGTYISFGEPVIIRGEAVGVAGIDVSVGVIKDLVGEYQIYDSGFALLRNQEDFFNTNDFISELSSSEKAQLVAAADAVKDGDVFRVRLRGVDYVGIEGCLFNGYELFILVPFNEYNAENVSSLLRFLMLFPAVSIVVFFLSLALGRSISKPIVAVSQNLGFIAKGNYSEELPQRIRDIPDEVGDLARVAQDLRLRLAYLTNCINTISDHDLTGTVELAFPGDMAAISLNGTIDNLNDMFRRLTAMAEQQQSEAANLADGSNMLSNGCAEQTNAVNELIEIMEHIIQSNKDNVEMLTQALAVENIVKSDAQAGDENMGKLSDAVREINEASKGIHKILKAIEDIAFQTNILALNAAVEAARAGQHGKGFAVVAEEVRNLAAKSALAAKETADLVSVSTKKAEEGEELAAVTAESLAKIIEGIAQTEQIIGKIEQNSHKNDSDIALMNKDLTAVSSITQRTASTAEETAAMSEELKEQASSLADMVSVFRIKG